MKIYIKSAIVPIEKEPYDVRYELAEGETTDASVLDKLSNDSASMIVYQVLKNPNTSPETLKRIISTMKDPNSYKYDRAVAELAMENPNMPVEILQDIEGYPHLLKSIAANRSTPIDVIEKLIKLGKDNDWRDILSIISANPKAPMYLISEIMDGNSLYDKTRLARNPNLPKEIQERLFALSDVYVNENLADNPGTDPTILRRLAISGDGFVSGLAKSNPNYTKPS